jgi:type IV fimbrial biogenesis protein FimT
VSLPSTTVASRGHSNGGFTLIELLVVMAIVGVLMTVVLPSFSSAFLSNRLTSYANAWIASAQLARSEARNRGAAVTLCASSNQSTCAASGTWQQGWVIRAADGTVLGSHEALSSDYHFTSSSSIYTITFQAGGLGATATDMVLCRASPSAGEQERQIRLLATGKPSVSTTRNGTCS